MVLMSSSSKFKIPDKLENIKKVNQAAKQMQLKRGKHYEAWKAGIRRFAHGLSKRK